MTLTEHRVGDVTLLTLQGRLVYDEGDAVLRARMLDLLAEGRCKVVLDLRAITALDSCGVGELVARLVSARQQGGDVKLVHLSSRSHRVMEISRLLGVFESFESEEDAIARFTDGLGG